MDKIELKQTKELLFYIKVLEKDFGVESYNNSIILDFNVRTKLSLLAECLVRLRTVLTSVQVALKTAEKLNNLKDLNNEKKKNS